MNNNLRITGIQVLVSIWATLFFIFKKEDNSKYLYLFIYLILITFLFWTGGRGSVFAFIITFMIFARPLYRLCKHVKKSFFLIFMTTIVAFFISENLSVCPWNGISKRIVTNVNMIENNISSNTINNISSSRIKIYKTVYINMNGHWVNGFGPQAFLYFPNRPYSNIQPHSFIIQFLIEWGIIGTLAFILLLIYVFYRGTINHIIKNTICNQNLFSGMIITSLTIQGIFDGTYYHAQPLYYLAIAYALWLQPNKYKDTKHDTI